MAAWTTSRDSNARSSLTDGCVPRPPPATLAPPDSARAIVRRGPRVLRVYMLNARLGQVVAEQPMAIIFPEAGSGVEQTAAELGLVHVVDFPFMVRHDAPIEPEGNDSVVVRPAIGPQAAEANVRVLTSAFSMPEDAVRRVLPASLVDAPNVDVFLASIDDVVVGTVTVIHHGDTSGIWSMATDTTRQRSGIGRRLLSTAMAETRMQGARRFYLGATPAGYRLYESVGFTTRVVAKVWASGETHQA